MRVKQFNQWHLEALSLNMYIVKHIYYTCIFDKVCEGVLIHNSYRRFFLSMNDRPVVCVVEMLICNSCRRFCLSMNDRPIVCVLEMLIHNSYCHFFLSMNDRSIVCV